MSARLESTAKEACEIVKVRGEAEFVEAELETVRTNPARRTVDF